MAYQTGQKYLSGHRVIERSGHFSDSPQVRQIINSTAPPVNGVFKKSFDAPMIQWLDRQIGRLRGSPSIDETRDKSSAESIVDIYHGHVGCAAIEHREQGRDPPERTSISHAGG